MQRTDDFEFQRIPAPLTAWYNANKRMLPWRENPTPYRVWVSEIMLQQTRVEAAKEYYLRFLDALPDVFALAKCEEERLLKLWEGLGYYSRVRNMQKTAKILVENYGGEFPSEERLLKKLPGIGDYTAGAILSIAFFKPVPAVDGNVLRVLSRLSENPTDVSEPEYRAYLFEKLKEVYPPEGKACSDLTQALMELGALVCKPQSPACEECPLTSICRAYASSTQSVYPVMPEKKEKRRDQVYVFVIRTPEGICIRRRESGVLKGMHEFPSVLKNEGDSPESALRNLGMENFTLVRQKRYIHIFTHIRWEMECWLVEAKTAPFETCPVWKIEQAVSLPTAFKQCLDILYLLG